MRVLLAAALFLAPAPLFAQSLIPGPTQPGSDAALHALAAQYDRQFHIFNAWPFGIALEMLILNPDDRALIAAFLAQHTEQDFAVFAAAQGTPRTIPEMVASYDGLGDVGIFGGVPAAADAMRYAILRDSGAPAAEIDVARQKLLDAINVFHIFQQITGEPGAIARGIRRTVDPGPAPEPFSGTCASSWERGPLVWRTDQSGRFPDWYWLDNTSKDQMIGYVYALGVFWDVVAADRSIPQNIKDDLQADALALGRLLMQPTEVRSGVSIDLVIHDTNGCITRHHDLNPREVVLDSSEPLVFDETSNNRIGFNAIAALGIMRTLYHVSGDAALRTFYYDELITARQYINVVGSGLARLRNMFANACVASNCVVTNFSNVHMAYLSIYGVLRYETDPVLRTSYQQMLADELWTGPRPHMGLDIQQAFFNVIYAGFKSGATDDLQADNAAGSLVEWPEPPYFNSAVENCDAAEEAAGSCLAIDGATIIELDSIRARGGGLASTTTLPKRLRPPNGWEWRSDPRVVNGGGGGDLLHHGGDFRAAYWLGRFLERSANSDANVSPIGRNRDGSGGPPIMPIEDAGVIGEDAAVDRDAGVVREDAAIESDASAGADADVAADAQSAEDAATVEVDAAVGADAGVSSLTPAPESDSSCGCTAAERSGSPAWILSLFALAIVRTRKR